MTPLNPCRKCGRTPSLETEGSRLGRYRCECGNAALWSCYFGSGSREDFAADYWNEANPTEQSVTTAAPCHSNDDLVKRIEALEARVKQLEQS